ncbi:amino acid adenylation domain-containing protein [Anaerolineales bacterium HSG24]|nr:amino acid adenylation domain-containing protein [Anaerolineales bacterium HSG24]
MPIQCADILLQLKNHIHGIFSSDPIVKQWANKNNIPCYTPSNNSLKQLTKQPFDYLFSIVNDYILPPEILALPRQYPINYHDAPLPAYGGMYATSWAIMNQETKHGITWHIMTDKIDAGDILKQKQVNITSDDTALTLNTKCYEAAIEAFRELVSDLNHTQVTPIPQGLDQRTYFSLYKRPDRGGVISWQQSAEEIDALVRALTFGTYPNYLGMSKIAIRQHFVIVTKLKRLTSTSMLSPGTITHIDEIVFTVSTSTNDIMIQELLTLDGLPFSINEFITHYQLHVGDKLPELAFDMADTLTTTYTRICKHELFWLKRLETLELLNLPYFSHIPTPISNSEITVTSLSIPIATEIITSVYHHYGSLPQFLSSVFIAYLARLTDTDIFDCGLDVKTMLSLPDHFFAPQIPLRIEINPDHSFTDTHQTIQNQIDLTIQHVSYAQDITVRYPQLQSAPSFQVVIAYCDTYQPPTNTVLTCLIPLDEADGASIQWLYNPQQLAQTDVNRMARQFTCFLGGIVKSPHSPLWKVSLLNQTDLQQLLIEHNNTRIEYPLKFIHHLFEEQVKQFPDQIAVICERDRLTYTELNQQSNQLAHYLQTLGVGPETLVGICIEPSITVMVGLLGILKAGAAYLPLDPFYPTERLNFMVENSQISFLVIEQQFVAQFQKTSLQHVIIDKDWETVATQPIENPISQNSSDDLAYVIYTSGSTGQPKGTMISHRGLINYLNWARQAYNVTDGTGAPVHTSISFDLTITSLFLPLLVGRTITLLSTYQGSEALSHILRTKQEFSLIKITPAHLDMLSQLLHPQDITGQVNRFIIGGEALRNEHLTFWQQHTPQTKLINEYGPTETVVGCCTYEVSPKETFADTVPIGRPIANTQLYVLNRYRQPVPVGVSGELYIGGHGVGRGYLNLSEQTTKKFIPVSECELPLSLPLDAHSRRLYKTGDIVRYLPDGNLEFLGRSDNQVKIRGYRIELDEIASTLNQHPDVDEVVVTMYDKQNKNKQLGAYLVLKNQVDLPESMTDTQRLTNIQVFLTAKLPEYMVPTTFTIIETIPLTSNGKVDHHILETFNNNATQTDALETYIAPRNTIEETLVLIWQTVLDIERVGVQDNFFSLGGHSLLATQIISQIRDNFQVEISLRSLFEGPTIAELTQHIETLYWIKQTALDMINSKREEGEI